MASLWKVIKRAVGNYICQLENEYILAALTVHTCVPTELTVLPYLCYQRGDWTVKKPNVFTQVCSSVRRRNVDASFCHLFRSPLNDFHRPLKGELQAWGLKAICQESSAWSHTNHFETSFSIFVSMFSPINRYGHYWPIAYNPAKESGASASQQWIGNRIAGLYVKFERNGKAMYW